MREVEIKTATERDKNPWPLPPTYRRLLGNTEDGCLRGGRDWDFRVEFAD